ncbi:hypothetical protein [Halopelagius fulvigenes]|uniref:DUF8152 domain-containing protein n=1 Tax=Halopelagius fulvigenes TaxID=1198324 RepID=A0ABD5TTE2_9EURY
MSPDRNRAPIRELVADLSDHLESTAELPVERPESAYLGEAEAVASDVASLWLAGHPSRAGDADVSLTVVRSRIEHVEELLSNVESTESEAANDHVEAAKALTEDILARLDGRSE